MSAPAAVHHGLHLGRTKPKAAPAHGRAGGVGHPARPKTHGPPPQAHTRRGGAHGRPAVVPPRPGAAVNQHVKGKKP